jgi:hypothetical protein
MKKIVPGFAVLLLVFCAASAFAQTPDCTVSGPSAVGTHASITVTAHCTNTDSTTTYIWLADAAGCSSASSTCTVVAPDTPDLMGFIVEATNGSGTGDPSPVHEVQVNDPSCSSLTATPSAGPVGVSVQLAASCSFTIPQTTYQWTWSYPGSPPCSSSSTTCNVTLAGPVGPKTISITPHNVPPLPSQIFTPASVTVNVLPLTLSCTLAATPAKTGVGEPVTLQASCGALPPGASFTWSGPNASSCSSASSSCTLTPPAAAASYNYAVYATTLSAASATASAAVSVLAPSCSLTASPPSPAPGGAVALHGACSNPPAGASYKWVGPNTGNCPSTSTSCNVQAPTASGSYVYFLTVSGSGVAAAARADITVGTASAPSCSLSATPATPAPGAPVLLQGACSNLAANAGYAWSGPGTNACSSSSSSCNVNAPAAPGPYAYTLVASVAGVSAPAATASIEVVQQQAPSCTLTATPAEALAGDAIRLVGNCGSLPSGASFAWSGPGTQACSPASSSCSIAAPGAAGSYAYTLIATVAGVGSLPAGATVNVKAPTCTLSATPASANPGDTLTLTGSCLAGPNPVYAWSGSGTGVCRNTSCQLPAPLTPGAYTYTLTASSNGIDASGSASIVVGQPSCKLTATPNPAVPGATVALAGQCSALPQGTTYTWTGPGAQNCLRTSTSCAIAVPVARGTYTYGFAPFAAGLTVSFSVDITVAAALSKVSGDTQPGLPGQALANPLVVRVTDGTANGVPNIPVSWTSSVASDRFTPATGVTDTQGLASVQVTLGSDAGNRIITASAADLSVAFTVRDVRDVITTAARQLIAPRS